MKKFLGRVLISLFALALIAVNAPHAGAFFLDDFTNSAKDFFSAKTQQPQKSLTIDSNISLVPNGDFNKNGQIDAGDIVRFSYILTNTTNQEYSFATLKTNINRKQLNFIHNITGTASLRDDGKTIEIPNFRIGANQISTITFDARINYYISQDPIIATTLEFSDRNKKSIVKSLKKEIKAIRISKDKVPGMIKQQIKK